MPDLSYCRTFTQNCELFHHHRAAQILKIKNDQMQDPNRNILELLPSAPQALAFLRDVLDEKK